MVTDINDEVLVLVDTDPASAQVLKFASRLAGRRAVLATVDSKFAEADIPVVRSLSAQPSMSEILKVAAGRDSAFVAIRRDVADARTVVGELILGAGRAPDTSVPGYAVVLAPPQDRAIRRVLAVVDRGTGPISGFMTYVAMSLAARNDAALDVLVVGAPGEELSAEDEHEALAINREQEFLDAAIELGQRSGVATNWITAERAGSTWPIVTSQLGSGDYDLVVDEIGELSIAGRLRRGITVEESMAAGQAAELSALLLERVDVPVLLVIDSIRVGLPARPLLAAGALATAAVAVVGGGTLGPMAGAVPTASGSTKEITLGEQSMKMMQGLKVRRDELTAAGKRAAAKKRASRSSAKAVAKHTTAKPKVPKGGARAGHVRKAKEEQAKSRKALARAKVKLVAAKKAEKQARTELERAQAAMDRSTREVKASAVVLAETQERAEDVRADASGLTGLLPGGATEEDAQRAEQAVSDAQAWVDGALARAADVSIEPSELVEAELDAAEKVAKREVALAEAKAELAEAKAQTGAVTESYEDYVKAQQAKAKAQAEARARAQAKRARALASSRMTPVSRGSYRISARFGQGGGRWSSGYHTGLDFAAPAGTAARAAASGTVTRTGWAGAYGNQIVIDHGNGIETTYNHLSAISVSSGQRVTAGDRIGAVGSTGNSTGPHLHFEVIRNGTQINPAGWLGM